MDAYETVVAVYRPGVSTHELVELCIANADADAMREAAYQGFSAIVAKVEAHRWREINGPESVRSGHQNQSGRFSGLDKLPRGVGILDTGIRLNNGTALKLGEADTGVLRQWREDFRVRVAGNQAGVNFADSLLAELTRRKKRYVRQLGENRVREIRKSTGFRVSRPRKEEDEVAA